MYRSLFHFYSRFFSVSIWEWLQIFSVTAMQSASIFCVVIIVNRIFNVWIPGVNETMLFLAVGLIAAVVIFSTLLSLFLNRLGLQLTKRGSLKFREHLIDQLLNFSKPFIDRSSTAKLQHHYNHDANKIDEAQLALIVDFFPSLVAVISLNMILIALDSWLYMILVTSVPPLLWVSKQMASKLSRATSDYNRAIAAYSSATLNLIETHDLIHLHGTKQLERDELMQHARAIQNAFESLFWLKGWFVSSQNFIVTVSALIVLAGGGLQVISGGMSLGLLVAFYVALGILKRYLMSLASTLEKLVAGAVSLEAIEKTLGCNPRMEQGSRERASGDGSIILNNVAYGYGHEFCLQDVSFEVKPGTFTAIVGPNGCGKTTLLNLIAGFFQPEKGEIVFDGVSHAKIEWSSFMRQVGVVTQTPLIRKGTVRENILYGREGVTHELFNAVARLCRLEEMVMRLPNGYDTEVGERGVQLSGGEKQRIAIARALVHQPKLLILDEPTNHLDHETLSGLFKALKEWREDMAILSVSHDETLIQQATQVVRLGV